MDKNVHHLNQLRLEKVPSLLQWLLHPALPVVEEDVEDKETRHRIFESGALVDSQSAKGSKSQMVKGTKGIMVSGLKG